MNHLNQLLDSIEHFHRLATSLPIVRAAEEDGSYTIPDTAEGIVQFAEDLSYDIDNEQLLSQFESLLNTYKAFLQRLHTKPEDFEKDADESADEATDDLLGLYETLKTRWERVVNNPYLRLNLDDDRYTEPFPPEKVLSIAQAISASAQQLIDQEAEKGGTSTEELAQAQRAAETYNQTQYDKRDQNVSVTGDRVEQQLAAQRESRKKLKFIKKIGPNHPQWTRVQSQIVSAKRWLENIKQDPAKWAALKEKWKDGKKQQRQRDKEVTAKIQQIQTTTNPSERARLMMDLVKMQRQKLENSGLNLDNPEVAHDPEVRKLLNPENIIAVHLERMQSLLQSRKKETTKIQEAKKSGSLKGLIIELRQNLHTYKHDHARKLQKQIISLPAMQPYNDAVNAAQRSGNAAALKEAADKQYEKANALYREHGSTKAIERDFPALVAFRDKLAALDKTGILDKPEIPPAVKTALQGVCEEGQMLIQKSGAYKRISMTLELILNLLKSRIS